VLLVEVVVLMPFLRQRTGTGEPTPHDDLEIAKALCIHIEHFSVRSTGKFYLKYPITAILGPFAWLTINGSKARSKHHFWTTGFWSYLSSSTCTRFEPCWIWGHPNLD